jgi:hypothetical protein
MSFIEEESAGADAGSVRRCRERVSSPEVSAT